MKMVIQRVTQASVTVEGQIVGQIGEGILIFLGIHKEDVPEKTLWLVQKAINLRMFHDAEDKMNRSLLDIQGEALVVSQFTLYGNCMEGRRPDFFQSAAPSLAEPLYNQFVAEMKKELACVQTGVFGAKMQVSLINNGPVTFIIER
jgi:D-aminoacyl-tRNA deacylase